MVQWRPITASTLPPSRNFSAQPRRLPIDPCKLISHSQTPSKHCALVPSFGIPLGASRQCVSLGLSRHARRRSEPVALFRQRHVITFPIIIHLHWPPTEFALLDCLPSTHTAAPLHRSIWQSSAVTLTLRLTC